MKIPTQLLTSYRLSVGIAICAFLSVNPLAPQASAQTLKLQYTFEDSGVTTIDSIAGVPLLCSNSVGAVDLHGPAGSGVGGHGHALNLSYTGVQGSTGGSVAFNTNSSAINFGTVTNFTMTMWIKPSVALINNPRFFFLGPSGAADVNTAGTMGLILSSSSTSVQGFLGATSSTFNNLPVNMVSNRWSFLAMTYDGTNLSVYNASETASVSAAVTAARSGTLAVGSTFRVFLGNNNALTRSFDGYMDDVRFYTGSANAAFLETVRRAGLPDPYVAPATVSTPVASLGGTAMVSSYVSGTAPLYCSWLFTDTNGVQSIVGTATNASAVTTNTLTISNVGYANVGTYSLIVSNNPGGIPTVVTNASVSLAVRPPNNLVWVGSASIQWNTNDINWDSNNDGVADTNYSQADNVQFTDTGISQSTVDTEMQLTPSSIVVSNTLGNYLLTTLSSGSLSGVGTLQKKGSSQFTLDVDDNLSGSVLINGGVLQIGNGSSRGSLGSGNVTNVTGLVFNRTGSLTIANAISGAGNVTIATSGANTVGNITLTASNSYSGTTEIDGGTLTLANNNALGNSTQLNVISTTAGGGNTGTRVALSGGISIPNTVTLSLPSTFDTARSAFFSLGNAGSTNIWNGPIVLNGNGNISFAGDGNSVFVIAGNVSGPTYDSSAGGALQLRATPGYLTGTVNLPTGNVLLTDGVLWNIHPPTAGGNVWSNTVVASGTMQCGINNALPTSTTITFGQSGGAGVLDLAGFNQTVHGLVVASVATAVSQLITNSNPTANATLTVNSPTPSVFGGAIKDGIGKINVTVTGGSLELTNSADSYSGNTTISGGALLLDSPILNSNSTVSVSSGASLNLNFAATNQVNALILNGVSQPNGLYNSTTSPSYITGTGSLHVGSLIATNPTNILFSVIGNTIALSWPVDHQGWILQSQTNNISTGMSTNWVDIGGTSSTTSTNITINPLNPTVFYRLRSP